jgi:hypothetical protein
VYVLPHEIVDHDVMSVFNWLQTHFRLMTSFKPILLLDYADFVVKDGSTGSLFEAPDPDYSFCCCKEFVVLYVDQVVQYYSDCMNDIGFVTSTLVLMLFHFLFWMWFLTNLLRGHHGHDCMVVGFISIYTISAHHH